MLRFSSLILIFITLFSCDKESALEEKIAKIKVNVNVERFDKLLAQSTVKDYPTLKESYPFMFSKRYPDSFWISRFSDTLQQELLKESIKAFPEFNKETADITFLFQHLKFYFPRFKQPRVITTTSDVDYRNKVIVTDTIALISIDTYLGSDHEFYDGIPRYLNRNFTKEQIVVDMANEYAKRYVYHSNHATFLDEMIYFGKLLYFKDIMLPLKSDAEKIGYTEEEVNWALANENDIWRYFVEKELLYSTDTKLLGRFINPAPFSKFYLELIDNDSPGRLGQYIGWQIVKAYMGNNDVKLKDMLITDAKEIFNKSKFKPKE